MNTISAAPITIDSGAITGTTIRAGKATIGLGDIVSIAGSSIPRAIVDIHDTFGARAVRVDGGTQAVSVWTKQYARMTVVRTAAEHAEIIAAKAAPKPRATRTPKVAQEVTGDAQALLQDITDAVLAEDSVGRNRAIIAAANAGVERKQIAAAAGLRSVGRYIRAAQREVTA
ncbi:hypothetical protein SEA_MEMENTOMORI_16 [Microbacterium phage MementoMori]|uniref:Uncharacterized protein n=1 Tax=Microbacterium phage MementoMori TaxID=2201436 RepID=A0A2Z4Q5Q9_9CAUD|nr:hypothetical protein HOT41_gp93 [Microbacterium phage MementoMori]AWY05270.1 hypothetical protein SEA_MEMENTOMORI_16 [Microbacterium phage MementoMori]